MKLLLPIALLFMHAHVAWACPSCPVGKLARSQVCSDGFLSHLTAVLLPFVVLGVITVWVERSFDRESRS